MDPRAKLKVKSVTYNQNADRINSWFKGFLPASWESNSKSKTNISKPLWKPPPSQSPISSHPPTPSNHPGSRNVNLEKNENYEPQCGTEIRVALDQFYGPFKKWDKKLKSHFHALLVTFRVGIWKMEFWCQRCARRCQVLGYSQPWIWGWTHKEQTFLYITTLKVPHVMCYWGFVRVSLAMCFNIKIKKGLQVGQVVASQHQHEMTCHDMS